MQPNPMTQRPPDAAPHADPAALRAALRASLAHDHCAGYLAAMAALACHAAAPAEVR